MPAIDARTALFVGLLIAAGTDGWDRWTHRPRHPPAGQIAEREPLQTETPAEMPPITRGRWTLKPRARYDITARILSAERYRFDRLAALVPEDLALGWGPMSDSRVLATMDISQSGRFYWWRPHADTPVPPETVITHSANTHVIPADERIGKSWRVCVLATSCVSPELWWTALVTTAPGYTLLSAGVIPVPVPVKCCSLRRLKLSGLNEERKVAIGP